MKEMYLSMDEKVREKARYAIKSILEAAGFSVSTLEDPFDLAEREDEYLMILCSNDAREIAEYNTGSYRLMKDGQEIAYKKLLFSLATDINAPDCVVWGRDEFIMFSGEAALNGMLGLTLPLTFHDEKGQAAGKRSATSEIRSAPDAGEMESPGMVIAHMPIRVQKQAAEKIARIQGQATLKLMPYWRYTYQSSGEQVYKDHRVPFDGEGSGGINAINGLATDSGWDALVEAAVPQSAEIVRPKITKEEAVEKIVLGVIDSLTQKIKIKQVIGDAISYEERVMKPDRKNISLQLQQVYIPIWQVRGKKIVEVNAHTGEVLAEPMDGGVEVF